MKIMLLRELSFMLILLMDLIQILEQVQSLGRQLQKLQMNSLLGILILEIMLSLEMGHIIQELV